MAESQQDRQVSDEVDEIPGLVLHLLATIKREMMMRIRNRRNRWWR